MHFLWSGRANATELLPSDQKIYLPTIKMNPFLCTLIVFVYLFYDQIGRYGLRYMRPSQNGPRAKSTAHPCIKV